jgi:hypothetical protein
MAIGFPTEHVDSRSGGGAACESHRHIDTSLFESVYLTAFDATLLATRRACIASARCFGGISVERSFERGLSMLHFAFGTAFLSFLVGFSIEGVVRASESGEPIAGVLVEAVDQGRVTWTDSVGRYSLSQLLPGGHHLRVSRLGYESRTADVFVASDSVLRVDIMLTSKPVSLPEVRVLDKWRILASTVPPDALVDADSTPTVLRFAGAHLHANPAFGSVDILHTLSILPEVDVRPELPTTLHVRGGSGDQNLILLDGVPLYNAFHAAGVLTALNPDVVSAVSVSPGVASVRHGGALSSVVHIETVAPDGNAPLSWRGTLDARDVGQTVNGPLPGGFGAFAVSGRRSTPQVLSGLANQTSSSASFGDLFAKGTVRSRRGDLEVFSFASTDRLAFDARVDPAGTDRPALAGDGLSAAPGSVNAPPQNGFAWRTGTQAIVWRGKREAPLALTARAWRTRFDAVADWAAATGSVQLASALSHDGVAAEGSRQFSSNVVRAGLSGERVHTEYGLRHAGVHDSTVALFPTLASSRVALSAFVEDEWRVAPRWTLTVGMREPLGAGQWRDVAPRASVRFAPSARLGLSAGYARTHQYVQSLRNEESVLDAVVGIALPVVAGTRGVPVARSDALTLTADAYLGAGATLSLGAYRRQLDGLLLVAPTTAQPFAMPDFSRGAGQASGLSALLDWKGERVSGHAGYAFGAATREAAGQRYRPSFAATHGFNMAIGYEPRTGTVLRAAFWSSTGRPASLVDGDLQWAPHNLLGGADEMAGTPERIVGALNAERLPRYARLDLGIRHDWRLGLGRATHITSVLNIANVLNRANSLGRTLSADSRTRRDIPLAPRSLTFGLAWSFEGH